MITVTLAKRTLFYHRSPLFLQQKPNQTILARIGVVTFSNTEVRILWSLLVSSFTVTKIIPSEKHLDCENAILSSIFPFKAATGGTKIRVDTAPGISAIINHSSEAFKEADIHLQPGDEKNKNSCAKVDKTMAELRAISPEGSPLSELSLQRATETLNMKIRNMNLSAREIMFSRLQNSNENIKLDEKVLSDTQFESRKNANIAAAKSKLKNEKKVKRIEDTIDLHSLVFIKHDVAKDKSKLRDLYMVTKIEEDSKIVIQKVLHPFTDGKGEINNRRKYRVRFQDVYLAPSQRIENGESVPIDTVNIAENSIKNKDPEEYLDYKPEVAEVLTKKVTKLRKFYSLPSESDYEDDALEFIEAPIVIEANENFDVGNTSDVTTSVEPDLRIFDTVKTYGRYRSKTYPQMSLRHAKPRVLRENVHQRWLRSKSKPPDIDILPSSSSSIMEPLTAVDQDFGVVPSSLEISWDHDTDLNSPVYNDEEENLGNDSNQIALDDIDEQDEVFEDVQLFENDPIQQNNHRLEQTGDLVQHGRVYWLGEKLANSASLWDQQQLEQPYRLDNRVAVNTDKIIIKRKRITSSSSSIKGLKDTKEKGTMKKEKEAMKK